MKSKLIFLPALVLAFSLLNISQKQADKVSYTSQKTAIIHLRDSLARENASISTLRSLFTRYLAETLPTYWYGTPWDFNGTSTTPGQGKIACGYFVSTILRDAGLKVDRIKLAQQASSNIIRSLCPKSEIQWYRNINPMGLAQKLLPQGKAIYAVGLDYHVGFLYVNKQKVWFIHASYISPQQVTKELAINSKALSDSNVYVVGRLDNAQLLQKWIRQEPIKTIGI